jgi:hypothetical protein
MRIREEYRISHRGKEMALYAGLLDTAHGQGLKSIETHLVQIPNDQNGQVAIVRARVTMEEETHFEGIGDASPENVGKNIAPHLIRMAETRAKARAMRDAINVSEALHDDPSDESEAHEDGPQAPPRTELGVVDGGGGYATTEQLETAEKLVVALEYDEKAKKHAFERWRGYTEQDMEGVIEKLEAKLRELGAEA